MTSVCVPAQLVVGLCCACAYGTPALAQQKLDYTWLSFVQLTAEHADGAGGLTFGADRVRAKIEVTSGRVTGTAALEFGADHLGDAPPGTLANVVADLYVNYGWDNHLLRVGQFKTPLGMDFNVPGQDLDLATRGMEAGLVLNRDLGIMLARQRDGHGFGYDLGLFNPPGRSAATAYLDSQRGGDNARIGRVRYDATQWHTEAAYGESPAAGGPGTSKYEVVDAGFRYAGERWNAKVEWLEGRGVLGVAGRTESVYYVHGDYSVTTSTRLVARHYAGHSDVDGRGTRLTNTYVGVSARVFTTPRTNGRVQVNYVLVRGDAARYTGVSGYRDDTLLFQFQVYAQR